MGPLGRGPAAPMMRPVYRAVSPFPSISPGSRGPRVPGRRQDRRLFLTSLPVAGEGGSEQTLADGG